MFREALAWSLLAVLPSAAYAALPSSFEGLDPKSILSDARKINPIPEPAGRPVPAQPFTCPLTRPMHPGAPARRPSSWCIRTGPSNGF